MLFCPAFELNQWK